VTFWGLHKVPVLRMPLARRAGLWCVCVCVCVLLVVLHGGTDTLMNSCAEHTGLFGGGIASFNAWMSRCASFTFALAAVGAATSHSPVGLRRPFSTLRLLLCFHPAAFYVILFVMDCLSTPTL
jgi:hypothetical protein